MLKSFHFWANQAENMGIDLNIRIQLICWLCFALPLTSGLELVRNLR